MRHPKLLDSSAVPLLAVLAALATVSCLDVASGSSSPSDSVTSQVAVHSAVAAGPGQDYRTRADAGVDRVLNDLRRADTDCVPPASTPCLGAVMDAGRSVDILYHDLATHPIPVGLEGADTDLRSALVHLGPALLQARYGAIELSTEDVRAGLAEARVGARLLASARARLDRMGPSR